MSSTLRNILLIGVDSFLIFAIIAILLLAWILRDGLGPDSRSTTGLSGLSQTFMTFYIGPTILLLASFDLLLRSRNNIGGSIVSRKVFIIPTIIILILIALGAVTFKLVSGH